MNFRLVATAGHVDHGKTTLLTALTGDDPDRLDEEKKRELTIDLGFASLKESDLQVGFIDVPGHHNFIKNMVSGVGSVQGVLFVVSAVDGWQEQSREHFEIIRLLEPEYCCFAITKIDQADEEMQMLVESEIDDAISGTDYEQAPKMRISSETGEGVNELKKTLMNDLPKTSAPPDQGKPYCPIDRSFTLQGQGTIVTGSLSGGTIKEGAELSLMPDGITGRVRSIQQYHKSVDEASPGSRVAVNVPDFDARNIQRGDILTVDSAGSTTQVADGIIRTPRSMKMELQHNKELLAYLGTARTPVRLLLGGRDDLSSDEQGIGRIKWLEDTALARPGDKIILRDSSDRWLLGRFSICTTEVRGDLSEETYERWLMDRYPVTPENLIRTELAKNQFVNLNQLESGTAFSMEQFEDSLSEMDHTKEIETEWIVDAEWWETEQQKTVETIRNFHEENPLRKGIPVSRIYDRFDELSLARALMKQLRRDGRIERRNDNVSLAEFSPDISKEDQSEIEDCLEKLNRKGLETPDRSELEQEYGSELINYMVESDRLVELSAERLISSEVYDKLKSQLKDFIQEDERRISEIRDHLDSSRKYVIPLMEYLDRQGLTIRDGDIRHWLDS